MASPNPYVTSLTYVTAHTAVLQMDPGALFTKMEIKHAFHQLSVHSADRHRLAMIWKGIDTCLAFRLRSAP